VHYLRDVLSTVNDNHEPALNLDIEALFKKLRLAPDEETRPPFSTAFIQDVLLDQKKLSGMDEDGRLLICALADTGARPREIVTRTAEDIVLDADVPHIKIRPRVKMIGSKTAKVERGKTAPSTRDIPLVGAALYAFEKRPEGFTRYADNVNSFTSRVNKFLRENDLLESDKQSLYSLRHSFQDRLTALEVGERMDHELMGHALKRPQYGDGPTLEHKRKVLLKMAFKVKK
jgi:integrase